MSRTPFNFCRTLSAELDPEKLQRKFLMSLLELQNVERGSIWVKKQEGYQCIDAVGSQSEKVKGLTIGSNHSSIVGWVIENRKMTIAEPGKDDRHFKEVEEELDVKSRLILCFPLFLNSGEVYGAIQIIDTTPGGSRLNLSADYLDLLQGLIDIGSVALSNSLMYTDQVKENIRLKQSLESLRNEELIISKSVEFGKILKTAQDYAKTDFPVLITGESGTGKELVARRIHRLSDRRDKPFLIQNCSAIPDTLLESELFGYEKGAFTGAIRDKVGLFEAANGGTVFLDEIGDMPMGLQARILRVIQNNEIKPLGGTRARRISVRIVSATNKNLKEAVENHQFREDLFYRLNVLPLHVPPLRERQEDIHVLLDHFIKKESHRMGIASKKITKDAMKSLLEYTWRGNVRELENFVKHIIVVVQGEWISSDDLQTHFSIKESDHPASQDMPETSSKEPYEDSKQDPSGSAFEGLTWDELERAYVLYLLHKNKWHITRAAKEAGLNRSTFDSRMKRLGIRK